MILFGYRWIKWYKNNYLEIKHDQIWIFEANKKDFLFKNFPSQASVLKATIHSVCERRFCLSGHILHSQLAAGNKELKQKTLMKDVDLITKIGSCLTQNRPGLDCCDIEASKLNAATGLCSDSYGRIMYQPVP